MDSKTADDIILMANLDALIAKKAETAKPEAATVEAAKLLRMAAIIQMGAQTANSELVVLRGVKARLEELLSK